ncbi:MAG: hypothetical protein OJJ21_06360 [Ferrovibrio sp.]|uniref:LPD7 domain-containing protein n=1 Tax=Ferrovibrio sp. TaxID=1917215 RepID=UPI00262D7DDF|nr:LPD7 domain-containing protein [Ferrovibrio sp.]MCW0233205.1 hypothetical protein [Ferrovibrio sp.]
MILTSNFNSSAQNLARHLLKPENEEVTHLPGRHVLSDDLESQLTEIAALSGRKRLWHVTFNPDRPMTDQEWDLAVGLYEMEFGLADVPRAAVQHAKPGDGIDRARHRHLVWATEDPILGFKFRDRFSKVRGEKVARLIEFSLGMTPTKGAHNKAIQRALATENPAAASWLAAGDFDKGSRPVAELTSAEREMKKRTGDDPRDLRAALLAAWLAADNSPTVLIKQLAERGVMLQKGERRGLVLVRSSNGAVQEVGRALNQALRANGLPRIEAGQINKLRATLYPTAYTEAMTAYEMRRLKPLRIRAKRPAEVNAVIRGPQTNRAKAGYKVMRLALLYGIEVDDLPDDIGDIIGFIDGNTVKSRSGALITDRGETINATAPRSKLLEDDAIRLMIEIAAAKGWQQVTLDGSPEFKARAAKVLAEKGIQVLKQEMERTDVNIYKGKRSAHAHPEGAEANHARRPGNAGMAERARARP